MSNIKDLDDFDNACENAFGLISGMYVYALWEMSTAAGSKWRRDEPETMDIIVTQNNAEGIYAYCKAIRSEGYNIGLNRKSMNKIKEARLKAHQFLWDEANNPNTSIERKIELVKLTSKNQSL